jgi:site-specific recombinase XerD
VRGPTILKPAVADLLQGRQASALHHFYRVDRQTSVPSISMLVSSVMTRAGIDESAHTLRNIVATRLAREYGRDLALVADILGHGSEDDEALLAIRPGGPPRRR